MSVSKQNHYGYNKNLKTNANRLRKNMTKAEACLWKYVLRAGGVQGFTFRRQRPVLNYIADFMCKELMLIIEAAGDPVDGSIHDLKEVIENDVRRQEHLEQAGFKVIRFTNEEVLHHINSVQQTIEDEVKAIMDQENIAAPQRGKYRRRKT